MYVCVYVCMYVLYFCPVVSSIFFPRLFSAVADWVSTILPHMVCVALVRIWDADLKRATRGSMKIQDAKIANLLNSNISPICPYNMVSFSPLPDEIVSLVWGTPANFKGFRILAPLLHGTLVVGVSQTLRR